MVLGQGPDRKAESLLVQKAFFLLFPLVLFIKDDVDGLSEYIMGVVNNPMLKISMEG